MAQTLGIDVGGTNTKLAVVDSTGRALRTAVVPTTGNAERFNAALTQAALTLIDRDPVQSAGLAMAGLVDDARTLMTFNPNIPWLEGYPLRSALTDSLRIPVTLDTDSNAAALGEYTHGAGKGARRLLCLTIGTGVGGAFLIEGSPCRLAHQGIGDPGHVIVAPDGPRCSAGCSGCAEAMISAPALEARAGVPLREILSSPRHHAVVEEAGRYLGLACASLAALLFPDRIVIAGGVAAAGSALLAPAVRTFIAHSGAYYREGVELRIAELGSQAGVIGAAVVAR
ncbi:MAG: ROK family protein [Bryobacteraceae bacterium]